MQRYIIIALALVICLPFVIKSRVGGPKPADTAFSVVSSSVGLIRISGDVRYPGIYPLPANKMAYDVIKMAEARRPFERLTTVSGTARHLAGGDHLYFSVRMDGAGLITMGAIPARERIILGIPLDLNNMSAVDFDVLPGIGPVVAQRIVEYRQRNGGVMRLEQLREVEGIGPEKYKAIMMYF